MKRRFPAARQWALGLGLLALAVPFAAVDIPPITDLPQQMAQIRLLQEALHDPGGPYRIQWWEPNTLGYLPLWLASQVTSPIAAGRLALWGIGAAWVVALSLLAWRRQRSVAAAVLAYLLFFNHVLYWGLLNFLVGLPVFIGWVAWLEPSSTDLGEPPAMTPGRWIALAITAVLLYAAHILWLLAGGLYLACYGLQARFGLRRWLAHGLALTPVIVATALWYPKLVSRGFDSDTFWALGQRWHGGWWVSSAFGGLRGPTEIWLAVALLTWLLLGALAGWRRLRSAPRERPDTTDPELRFDGHLLAIGLAGVCLALVLPGVYQNTVFFASRWLPMGLLFVVLAVPPPPFSAALRSTLPILLLASASLATTDAWLTFEGQELEGLHGALERIEGQPNVLGLDFVRTSESIQGYPYYHLYAWSQALHGGELARSFANEASSLVVYRDLPRQQPWTPGLDWRARKLRRSDIEYFDYVIVHGDAEVQRLFYADPRLQPETPPRRWSLFKVRSPDPDPGLSPPQRRTTHGEGRANKS